MKLNDKLFMGKNFGIISPCVKCGNGGGCCGCSEYIEWDRWQKSLTDEQWNSEVIKQMDKEISSIKGKYIKMLR